MKICQQVIELRKVWLCLFVVICTCLLVTTPFMVQGYQVHRIFSKPHRFTSKTLNPIVNHVRFVSSSFALEASNHLFEVNQVISLKDGSKGKVIEKGKNGWMSIALENENKVSP